MRRRDLLRSGVFAAAATIAAPFVNRGNYALFGATRRYSSRTLELVGRTTVVDLLGLLTLDWQRLERWHMQPESFTSDNLQKLRDSGTTVFHPAVQLNDPEPHVGARRWLDRWNTFLAAHPEHLIRVDGIEDMARAKEEGRIGVLLGMQNSDHFRDVSDVDLFCGLGQRVSQLTYNGGNRLGSGCGQRRDSGLTWFGAEIIGRMNHCRMAVDVSHAGDQTTLDAIAASSAPVLITHSNCRALVPHPRCKPDAIIRAMARRGSVMGLTGIRMFVSRSESATLEDLLDHYDHVAHLVGVEHLAVGSDSDPDGRDQRAPGRRAPRLEISGINHPRRIFDLTEGLIRRGYQDRDLELILGGNVRRVLGDVFRA